jgi:hypothetical protein
MRLYRISTGVALFVNSSEGLQIGVSPDDYGKQGAIVCGLMLLGLYLVFDSFTSQVWALHFMRTICCYDSIHFLNLVRVLVMHASYTSADIQLYASWH